MDKEKVKEYVKKNWKKLIIDAVIIGGPSVCYIAGYRKCEAQWKAGLRELVLVDPELKTHIIDAYKLVNDRMRV